MDLSSHIQHGPVNRQFSVVSVLQPTSLNTPINNQATRSRSPWAPRRLAWTTWAPAFSWEFSATLTCSCRTNGRSTCARLIPAYQRKGVWWCQQKLILQHCSTCWQRKRSRSDDVSSTLFPSALYSCTLNHLNLHSPRPSPFSSSHLFSPVRSSSTGTCSGMFFRWSFHAPPHQTSSRSAWSCRSFSLSNSTPASELFPPGVLVRTCLLKPPSSTLRKELQSFVSKSISVCSASVWGKMKHWVKAVKWFVILIKRNCRLVYLLNIIRHLKQRTQKNAFKSQYQCDMFRLACIDFP